MRTTRRLVDLPPGARATVSAVSTDISLRRRLDAMGLRPGQTVQVLRRGWWSGPLHLRVGMTELMLRRRDAGCVALAA
jgi:ferrous iron transport protein A